MNRTQWYFFRQRLTGLLLVLVAINVSILIREGSFGLIVLPIGLYLMFTKRMVIMDKYFFEIEEKKLKKMQKRS